MTYSAHQSILRSTDFLILGSGFGGSLLAAVLSRAGKSVVMVDRSRHPRFAIGESSTPLADQTLERIARNFKLPELLPLCHWGSWKRSYPEILCGRKRGFTYFDLTNSKDLEPADFDHRRLLVSASADNEHSDTHWLRSDVDSFFCRFAESCGATAIEGAQYELATESSTSSWTIRGSSDGQAFESKAAFLIDATGSNGAVLKFLNVADHTHRLRTNSRSLFAHFANATSCEQLLHQRDIASTEFPFACDDAAVHQVLPDGWMWQLRFDDDSLSAGFMIDQRDLATAVGSTTHDAVSDWHRRLSIQPLLSRQFANARIIRPGTEIIGTGRIQRLAAQAAGDNWAAITNTVGFIDPLHSTGIAHTLFSIERLASILLATDDATTRNMRLADYSTTLIEEIRFVDELVEGCYASLPSFPLWCDWAMIYFAAVTSMEQKSHPIERDCGFLRTQDADFRHVVAEARRRVETKPGTEHVSSSLALRHFERDYRNWLRAAMSPWNHVGLFDDSCRGLYSRTAAPK